MNKTGKTIIIAAGVIALAVFYMLYADGRLFLKEENQLTLEDGITAAEAGQESTDSTAGILSVAAKDAFSASESVTGPDAAGEENDSSGLSTQEKEEIRQIVEACLDEAMKEELSTAIRQSLKESLDSMMADGSLATAVESYIDTQSQMVNINTADAEALMTLPGIGKAKAAAVIRYREENGSFTTVEQLTNVSGISSGILEQIRSMVTV